MFYVILAHVIFSVVMGFDAISAGWSAAFSLWGASLISVITGAGLRGSLYSGLKPIIGGLLLTCVFIALAQWLGTMYSVGLWGNPLSGRTWSVIGLIIGFVFTTKKFATSAIG